MFGYETDEFLGYKVARLGSARTFRVQQHRGRWFFVTPRGHPYLLIGANHSNIADSPARRALFAKRYGKPAGCGEAIAREMMEFGFNAAFHGYHPPLADHLPVNDAIQCTRNNYYRSPERFAYDDVFDPQFKRGLERRIRSHCLAVRDNPRYLGYGWTQAARWDIDVARATRDTDWVSTLRGLPPDRPGHQAYRAYLRSRYRDDLPRFNQLYGQRVADLDEPIDVSSINRKTPAIRRDDEGFLRLIARELFSFVHRTIRRHDDSHMIFGDKFLLHDHPDCVLEELAPYVDAVAVQPGGGHHAMPFVPENQPYHERTFDRRVFDHIHEVTGRPIVIADYNISFATPEYPQTAWLQYPTAEEAAEVYGRFLSEALNHPCVLGIAHCEYFSRVEGPTLRQGVISPSGDAYGRYIEILKTHAADATRRALSIFDG